MMKNLRYPCQSGGLEENTSTYGRSTELTNVSEPMRATRTEGGDCVCVWQNFWILATRQARAARTSAGPAVQITPPPPPPPPPPTLSAPAPVEEVEDEEAWGAPATEAAAATSDCNLAARCAPCRSHVLARMSLSGSEPIPSPLSGGRTRLSCSSKTFRGYKIEKYTRIKNVVDVVAEMWKRGSREWTGKSVPDSRPQ